MDTTAAGFLLLAAGASVLQAPQAFTGCLPTWVHNDTLHFEVLSSRLAQVVRPDAHFGGLVKVVVIIIEAAGRAAGEKVWWDRDGRLRLCRSAFQPPTILHGLISHQCAAVATTYRVAQQGERGRARSAAERRLRPAAATRGRYHGCRLLPAASKLVFVSMQVSSSGPHVAGNEGPGASPALFSEVQGGNKRARRAGDAATQHGSLHAVVGLKPPAASFNRQQEAEEGEQAKACRSSAHILGKV